MLKLQLTKEEKEEILNEHLPYKITQLRTHVFYNNKLKKESLSNELKVKYTICAIEISFIASRLFIEFLGLCMKNKKLIEKSESDYRSDDLSLIHFDCLPIQLKDLSKKEIEVLEIIYHRGNKGAGHFTWEKREKDGWEYLNEGVEIITRLLNKHLYEKLRLIMIEK